MSYVVHPVYWCGPFYAGDQGERPALCSLPDPGLPLPDNYQTPPCLHDVNPLLRAEVASTPLYAMPSMAWNRHDLQLLPLHPLY